MGNNKKYKLKIENEVYYNLEDLLYQDDNIFLIYDLGRNYGSLDYELGGLTLGGKYFDSLFDDLRTINENIEFYTNRLSLLIEDKERHLLDNDEEWYEDEKEKYEESIEEYAQEYRNRKEDWLKLQEDYFIFDLYAYVHSGVSFSTSYNYPYNCEWDSMQCGYLFIKKEEFKHKTQIEIEKMAEYHVEYLDDLSNGNVYNITLEEITTCKCCKKKQYDYIDGLSLIVGSKKLKEEVSYLLKQNDLEEKDISNLEKLKEEWYF